MQKKQTSKDTSSKEYSDRLTNLSNKKWKNLIDVQKPYRWNMNRMELGTVIDVGCGIGRNLKYLTKGSIGVDHNKFAVQQAKNNDMDAYTVDEFMRAKFLKNYFDSMLLAHVLEHLSIAESRAILKMYLPYVRNKVLVICPQEKGYKSDATHVTFLQENDIKDLLKESGLQIAKATSFPLPKIFGKVFTYNETVVLAQKII